MKKEDLVIRTARVEDARMLAEIVCMGIGCEETLKNYCGEDYVSVLTEVARSEGAQYSYRNALVAEINGAIVGGYCVYCDEHHSKLERDR